MTYLLLAILSATANSLIFRLSEGRIRSRLGMLWGNYLVCFLLSLLYLQGAPLLPPAAGLFRMELLALLNGVLFLAGFLLIQRNIRLHGVVLSSVFSRLGVLVPVLMAVFLFGELPTLFQTAGLLLALAALLLLHTEKGEGLRQAAPMLLVMLLVHGSCDAMSKVYQELGTPSLSGQYLSLSFLVALVLNLALLVRRRERPGLRDLLFGAVLGIPNYFVARFLLRAVGVLPAVIVYPTYSVGSIILTSLFGVVLFRERLSRRQWGAMGLILLAIFLLN